MELVSKVEQVTAKVRLDEQLSELMYKEGVGRVGKGGDC